MEEADNACDLLHTYLSLSNWKIVKSHILLVKFGGNDSHGILDVCLVFVVKKTPVLVDSPGSVNGKQTEWLGPKP